VARESGCAILGQTSRSLVYMLEMCQHCLNGRLDSGTDWVKV